MLFWGQVSLDCGYFFGGVFWRSALCGGGQSRGVAVPRAMPSVFQLDADVPRQAGAGGWCLGMSWVTVWERPQAGLTSHSCSAGLVAPSLVFVSQGKEETRYLARNGAGRGRRAVSLIQGVLGSSAPRGALGPVPGRYEVLGAGAGCRCSEQDAAPLQTAVCSPQPSFPLNHLHRFRSAVGKLRSEYNG